MISRLAGKPVNICQNQCLIIFVSLSKVSVNYVCNVGVSVHLFSDRFLEADEGEDTSEFTQGDIAGVVDIASAQKVGGCGSHS